jgi:hypothetical protein
MKSVRVGRRKSLVLAARSRSASCLFVDTVRKWGGLLIDTFLGTDCVQKVKNSPKTLGQTPKSFAAD